MVLYVKIFLSSMQCVESFLMALKVIYRGFLKIVFLFCIPVKHLQAIIMLKTVSENSN